MQPSLDLIGIVLLALAAFIAYAIYRRHQRIRGGRVERWVKKYLVSRDGVLPQHLTINCTADPLWPVLVGFDDIRTGNQHRLQFHCPGPDVGFSLISEKREKYRLQPGTGGKAGELVPDL